MKQSGWTKPPETERVKPAIDTEDTKAFEDVKRETIAFLNEMNESDDILFVGMFINGKTGITKGVIGGSPTPKNLYSLLIDGPKNIRKTAKAIGEQIKEATGE